MRACDGAFGTLRDCGSASRKSALARKSDSPISFLVLKSLSRMLSVGEALPQPPDFDSSALLEGAGLLLAGRGGGGTAGSFFPGPGTVIGGVAGGIGGAVGGLFLGKALANAMADDPATSGGSGRTIDNLGSLAGASEAEVAQAVPDGWVQSPSRTGGGTRWLNPDRPGESVRIQPGNARDPNPTKRDPYVRVSMGGVRSDPGPLSRPLKYWGGCAVDASSLVVAVALLRLLLVSLGEGYFLEYSVAWQDGTGTWTVARLLQRASVPYSDVDERQDYAPVERVRDPMSLSVLTPPRWEDVDEAVWPLFRDKPMRFVGQVSLPENETTRQFLSWGLTVYLFYVVDDAGIRCKVIEQRAGTQSLEGHYREEERQ